MNRARTFYYDRLGRNTDDCVTNVGANTDATVLRISRGYEVRGMTQTITSASAATPGTGTVLNQVKLTYNTFGQLVQDQQEHGGSVTGTTPSVGYAYDSGGSSSNEIRFNQLTYPNGRTIAYSYGLSGGMSDYLNRVDAIQDPSSGTTTLSAYTYLGAGTVIRIQYPEPQVMLDLWGGTSGVFAGFDQFNRIIDQRWLSYAGGGSSSSSSRSSSSSASGTTDLDRYQYGYDRNSNRIWKANLVGTPVVAGGLDELYAYDPLNRLTQMQRGVLNSTHTALTATPVKEQDWTLDATGNWSGFVDKVNGTTDLNQTRSANKVNEITAIGGTVGAPWVTPQYDQAGNTIRFPQVTDPTQGFAAVYDAWNRMVSVSSTGGGSSSSSSSGGLSSSSSSSSRLSSSSSSGGSSSSSGRSSSSSSGLSSSGSSLVAQYRYDGRGFRILGFTYAAGSLSETRHFYFTSTWQDIEERVGASTAMSYQYVWGIRYIDELVLRDGGNVSSSPSSSSLSGGSLAQRLYGLQDGNFNGTAITNAAGSVAQRFIYDPYGAGIVVRPDYTTSSDVFAWTVRFTGQVYGLETQTYIYRTRYYLPALGRFGSRDLLGMGVGSSLYQALDGAVINAVDPNGTTADECAQVPGGTAYSAWAFLKQEVGPTVFAPGGAKQVAYDIRIVIKIYTRRYRELYECCDACDDVYWKWGGLATQGGTTESAATDQGGQVDAVGVGGAAISVPGPYGNLPIRGLSISGTIFGHSELNWKPASEPGPTPTAPTSATDSPPEDVSGHGYKVVTKINCKGTQGMTHMRPNPDPAQF